MYHCQTLLLMRLYKTAFGDGLNKKKHNSIINNDQLMVQIGSAGLQGCFKHPRIACFSHEVPQAAMLLTQSTQS